MSVKTSGGETERKRGGGRGWGVWGVQEVKSISWLTVAQSEGPRFGGVSS